MFRSFANADSDYAFIINGGANKDSNNQRYFENVHSMYDAFRAMGIPSNNITVLYGSGKVEDTNSLNTQPQFPAAYGLGSGYVPSQASVFSIEAGSGMTQSQVATQQGGLDTTAMPTTGQSVQSKPNTITLDYLFSGEKRSLDGGANSDTIKDKFRELSEKLKPGDNVTLYITDHGEQNPEGGTSVTLCGESMTVDQLGDLLREFPKSNQIRVVTNICYGGGLTELTSSNICVFANQQGNKTSNSESIDLDMYGQNFPYALKKKIDTDKDGKVTYWDAHQYATSLDNPRNVPTTSLDWFLLKNKNKILEEKLKKVGPDTDKICILHPDDDMRKITSLIEDFDRIKSKMDMSEGGIPQARQSLVKGRVEKSIQSLQNRDSATILEELNLKVQDLKSNLAESAKNWDKLSPAEQAAKRQQAQLDAQQIKTKISQLEKDRRKYEIQNLELDLLKYGDDDMIKEYSSIRRCLEYAY